MGEQSGIDNKFEVFLSVKGLEYYKYRIMFLRYGAIAYPVEVVLNEDIAEAYNGKKQYIYDVDSMEELKTMFETIINTDFCKMRKNYIPVHFNIEPSEIRGFLRHTTMFLPEQLVTINEEQIIQTAGVIVSTDAIKKVDAMLVRQLQIGEYDG